MIVDKLNKSKDTQSHIYNVSANDVKEKDSTWDPEHTHTQNKRKVWVRIWLSIVFFDKVFVWFFTGQVYHNYAQLPWTFAQLRQTELNLLFIIQSINQTIGISINSWRNES